MQPGLKKALLIIGSAVGVFVVVVGGLVAYLLFWPGAWDKDEALGGDWVVTNTQTPVMDGAHYWRLQRKHGWRHTQVAERPYPYQYIGDDCVLFSLDRYIYAACGDRRPILVGKFVKEGDEPVRDAEWNMFYNAFRHDPFTIGARSVSWADIKAHAMRGESYQNPN